MKIKNKPLGLEKTDSIENCLKRADELSDPNGSWYSGVMVYDKDARRIVLLAREYRRLNNILTESEAGK